MRTKRLVAVAAAGLLLLSACGREGEPEDVVTLENGSTPRPSASDDGAGAGASATPGATSGAGATAAPAATSSGGGGTGGGTQATAVPGKQNPPKDGRYTYNFSGKASDPTNPTAAPQSFSGEQYRQISHNDNVYTVYQTNSEDSTRVTTKTRWSDTKVELLSIAIQTQVGTFSCNFNPPLLITKFPVKAETYPTQQFKGEGNACNGKLDITIERQETQKDASGKSWNTWRAKVHTETKSDSFDLKQDETRWVSPDLGIEVRSEGTGNGTIKSGAFNGSFSSESTSVLKTYPS